ncbi:MAG: poly-beta-hydroxybutyrate polymerase N-terminal domain-containing protein, partial [Woeseiaceae bacterium]|nr:poly-beta-hydroxybutyrate polymerase N-terminal domain-containing protein [Woeseiaceae bacterium]
MTEESGKTRLLPAETARNIDHEFRNQVAVLTKGLSPVDVAAAVVDWFGHLVLSPGKMLSLAESVVRNGVELGEINSKAIRNDNDDLPPIDDRRMRSDEWQQWPFNVFAQSHRLAKEITSEATTGIDGVSGNHEQLVRFLALQVV